LAVADARAPWFFLWIQQLLKLGNPFFFGVLIPFGFILVLVAIPYIYPQGKEEQLGRWFPQAGRPVQVGILLTSLLIVLTVLALLQNPV
jgi:quinol-cytochrome oxidoreductase complex cytochrome b subunit